MVSHLTSFPFIIAFYTSHDTCMLKYLLWESFLELLGSGQVCRNAPEQ